MKTRSFGLFLLLVAGAAPLVAFAVVSIGSSQETAVAEVRDSNERLAQSIASRIAAYERSHSDLIRMIGAAALRLDEPSAVGHVLEDFGLSYPHLGGLAVYRASGELAGGSSSSIDTREIVRQALGGKRSYGTLLTPATRDRTAFEQDIAEPVELAGQVLGVIVARVDLQYMWAPLGEVRIGDAGFARLVTSDGVLLAHGNPEENRSVYDPERNPRSKEILAAARAGKIVENDEGVPVVASAADVPGRDWVVIVERPVSEAFAAAAAMTRNLIYLSVGAVVLAILLGVIGGRPLVKSLERLRAYTKILGRGELDARVETKAPVVEVKELAQALNDMAGSIQKLHDEARARERLSTFARVAAGLAHDLRQPIETVRAACSDMLADPGDENARELFEFMTEKELPRLKRYMEDLQRIAREGDVQLEPDDIVPLELAESVADDLRHLPKWQGVEFAATGRSSSLVADRNLLRRAIYNLAVNASDACSTKGPGGRVTIEVADSNDGSAVEFRVRDNGGGIAPDSLARLLEGDFHSTKRSTGVGLGFGVARHVAHAHGGRIDAQSEVGVGSTFTVRVPLAPSGNGGTGGSEAEIGGERVVGPASHATH